MVIGWRSVPFAPMASTVQPSLHPSIEPLAFLLGEWAGEGKGEYPTIQPFVYGEEIRFWHVGKPYLAYGHRTWNIETGAAMHFETGYWRLPAENLVEVVIAQPTGVAEVLEGTLDGGEISLRSSVISRTSTAKEVTETTRRLAVTGDAMTCDASMAAVGQPLTHHLHSELLRAALP